MKMDFSLGGPNQTARSLRETAQVFMPRRGSQKETVATRSTPRAFQRNGRVDTIVRMVTSKQKRASLPNRIPFGAWKQNVLRLLRPASSGGKAFQPWTPYLRIVYEHTVPLLSSDGDAKRQERLRDAISSAEDSLTALIGEIDAAGGKVLPKGSWTAVNIERLRKRLDEARCECRRTLKMVRVHRKEQNPKVYAHCMPFILELQDAGVKIQDIADICYLLMQAHGFPTSQLAVFTSASVKNKTLQHAINTHKRKMGRLLRRMQGEKIVSK